jgi:hypothetical protein
VVEIAGNKLKKGVKRESGPGGTTRRSSPLRKDEKRVKEKG